MVLTEQCSACWTLIPRIFSQSCFRDGLPLCREKEQPLNVLLSQALPKEDAAGHTSVLQFSFHQELSMACRVATISPLWLMILLISQ